MASALLRAAEAGEVVIVTRNGVASTQPGPIQPPQSVATARALESARRLPRVEAKRLRRDAGELLDQSAEW